MHKPFLWVTFEEFFFLLGDFDHHIYMFYLFHIFYNEHNKNQEGEGKPS